VLLGPVPDLYVGEAIDFDVKSDSGSDNYPGFDASLNLVYQNGYGSGNNPNQYAGVALHDPYKKPADQPAAYGGHVLRNDVYIYPQGGYRDDSLYSVMTKPGFSIYGNPGQLADYNVVLTAGMISSHTPDTSTYQYKFVVAFSNKGLDTLKYMVNMVRCGNANRGVDGMVNLGDVIKLANMILKQQEETWRYMSDVNGDCAVNLADCIYLVNYCFGKPGFPLRCNCEIGCGLSAGIGILDFRTVTVGNYKDLPFSITNNALRTLSGTVSETCDDYNLMGSTDYSLTPGQSQTFWVRFMPTSAGFKTCTIETGCGERADVMCTGSGQ
jgi:hypothetical protein